MDVVQVFRAEMAGSTPVAVKFVTRQSPRELRRFVHEIGILKSLRHTNIVQVSLAVCHHTSVHTMRPSCADSNDSKCTLVLLTHACGFQSLPTDAKYCN